MAAIPPDVKQRNENLDSLEKAVKDYVKKEKERLEKEVKFLKAVMKSRGGSSKVAAQNLADASSTAVIEINQFLTG